jgi:hypothetical protein
MQTSGTWDSATPRVNLLRLIRRLTLSDSDPIIGALQSQTSANLHIPYSAWDRLKGLIGCSKTPRLEPVSSQTNPDPYFIPDR